MPASGPISRPIFRLVPMALGSAVLSFLWSAWCEFPLHAWNEVRLAPAFALRHGINPYPPLGGGPLSTWIYGPFGIILDLPATWADSVAGALHAASLINMAVLILPMALIFFRSSELRGQGLSVPGFALTLAVLLIPRANFVLQVADHAAIACGLLSCWFLARSARPTTAQFVPAAAFCALAVWSKQIAVFLIAAQVIYLLLVGKSPAALRYLLWVAAWGLAALGVFIWAFGLENLWLNLVIVPGRLPWTGDFAARFAMRPWALAAQVVLPIAGLTLLWWRKKWPDREAESGRFFQLTVLAAAAMLPVGLAAYFKIGGDTNLLHSWDYLLPGAIMLWLATGMRSAHASVGILTATTVAAALHWPELTSPPSGPYTDHLKIATELCTSSPRSIWFPRNPLITFYADGGLWHAEDGIQTRYIADFGLKEADFRRHLPENLQAVVYPSVFEFPFSMALLPELNQTTQLPYWTVHTRRPGSGPEPKE